MIIHTTAEGISMARQLENDSAAFYQAAAEQLPDSRDILLNYARENKKFLSQVEQAYYGVITDAIEGCFALNLETDEFQLDTELKPGITPAEFITRAMQMEEVIQKYYLTAGEQCKSLMSDVSRSFTLTAKKRKNRLTQLAELSKV